MIMLNNLHSKLLQKKVIQKPPEATGDLIGNKIADKIISLKNFTTQKFGDGYK